MNSEIKLLIYFSRFERKQAKKNGAPERTRTSNHQNRNLLLYPLSYGHSAQLFYCTPLLKSSPTKNRTVLSDISSGSDHSHRPPILWQTAFRSAEFRICMTLLDFSRTFSLLFVHSVSIFPYNGHAKLPFHGSWILLCSEKLLDSGLHWHFAGFRSSANLK